MNWQCANTVLLCLLSCALFGHGDLDVRIAALSQQIKSHPDSALLYLQRGELHLQHEVPRKAFRDFRKCQQRGLYSTRLQYNFALAFYQLKKYSRAIAVLEELLENDPDHVLAYRLSGRSFFEAKEFEKAAIAHDEVIKRSLKTFPENYLEASMAYEKSQRPEYQALAKVRIEEGIEDLGPLRAFYNRLIELYDQENNFEKIIDYQSQIIKSAERKERAYFSRAQTHLKAKDFKRAKQDIEAAQAAIDQLNPRVIQQKATQELLQALQQTLQQINGR